jgi:hypothetical protein
MKIKTKSKQRSPVNQEALKNVDLSVCLTDCELFLRFIDQKFIFKLFAIDQTWKILEANRKYVLKARTPISRKRVKLPDVPLLSEN